MSGAIGRYAVTSLAMERGWPITTSRGAGAGDVIAGQLFSASDMGMTNLRASINSAHINVSTP